MNVLVFGGTGRVGRSIVKDMINAGHDVVSSFRSTDARSELLKYLNEQGVIDIGRLMLIEGSLDDDESTQELFAQIPSAPDLTVAALGDYREGMPLNEVSYSDWKSLLSNNLDTHFLAAKFSLNSFPDSIYVSINGEHSYAPVAGAGVISVADAAHQMLIDALVIENPSQKIKSLIVQNTVANDGVVQGSSSSIGNFILEEILKSGERNFKLGSSI